MNVKSEKFGENESIGCRGVSFLWSGLFYLLQAEGRAVINTHEGNISCCNLCSVLCRGHLYIVRHVSGTAPSPELAVGSQSSRQPGCKDAADNHSFR